MLSRVLFAAAVLLLLAAAVPACRADTPQPAPSLDSIMLNGKPFRLAEHRGHVVIIDFWATWCAPCRAEMPVLNAYYRQHHKEGLDMLAISMDDPADIEKVKSALKPFSFPAALYEDTQADGYGRITLLPQTLIVDRDGILQDAEGEGLITDISQLDKTVAPLLAAKSSQ